MFFVVSGSTSSGHHGGGSHHGGWGGMPPGGGGGAGSYPPPNLHLHDDSSSKSYEPSDVFCALGSLIAEGRLPSSSSADFSADISSGQEQQPLDMTTGTNESSTMPTSR